METKKVSLFDINAEQKLMIAEIEAMEGEITPEMEEKLVITETQLRQKSIAYLEVIKVKEGFNSLISDEIKRLQGLKKRNDKVVNNLKDNLLTAVKTFGTYEVGTQKFGTRKSHQLIVDIDPLNLPEIYRTQKLVVTADKVALKEALKLGEEIEGVSLVENQNLKIN